MRLRNWHDLLRERMRFYLFGHALYEKALRPFVGVTGRGILLQAENSVAWFLPLALLAYMA